MSCAISLYCPSTADPGPAVRISGPRHCPAVAGDCLVGGADSDSVFFNSALAYWLNRKVGEKHSAACPSALIGASNFFELAVAAAISLFGFQSGAALATVAGVLIEVPEMLLVVTVVNSSKGWYEAGKPAGPGTHRLEAEWLSTVRQAPPGPFSLQGPEALMKGRWDACLPVPTFAP